MAYEVYGAGVTGIVNNAGAPVAGTNEVQTLTIGGTPTAGSFKLTYEGATTAAIPWNSTNATLLASINAALDALATLGASWVVATAGTLTAGIGTILLTFSGGDVAKKAVSNITVTNNLTGTSPTLANAETTPGVDATRRNAALGSLLLDTTNRKLYINSGSTVGAPTWTVVGSQS